MVSAILFDFGGTLDSDGGHWLDRFYRIYDQIGLSDIPKERVKEAFYWADEQSEQDIAMRSAGLRTMMERHVAWQFEKLGLKDNVRQAEAAAAFIHPTERILHRNRGILEKLHFLGLKMGIISNFYGNVATLCQEFELSPFLSVILDSAVVGLKKPNPKLFKLACDQLRCPSTQTGFVGDSYERDIKPAKAIGMRTYWLIGDEKRFAPDPGLVDVTLRSLEELPELLRKERAEKAGLRG